MDSSNSNQWLIFDVWGDYAHFKKFYTTASPLTFSIPPRTALIGLVSAILGYPKDSYFEKMLTRKAKFAIRILNQIKKTRLIINFINTKDNFWTPARTPHHEPRTQYIIEFLKDPRYRIYFLHEEREVHNSFKEMLINHKSFYTPYLGITELIANFEFIGETETEEEIESSLEQLEICSAIPIDQNFKIEFESDKKYFKEKIPIEMTNDRIVTNYREVLFEASGKTIRAKKDNLIKLKNGDCIAILK